MSRHHSPLRDRATFGELPADLYVVPGPWPRLGRPVKHDVETWRVVDDWPARVPVTDAEVEVFEAWFGDVFDEVGTGSRVAPNRLRTCVVDRTGEPDVKS